MRDDLETAGLVRDDLEAACLVREGPTVVEGSAPPEGAGSTLDEREVAAAAGLIVMCKESGRG